MKKIKIYIPLITPFDKDLNIDYLSLEKLILYIINLENIDSIILFDKISEYYSFTVNEYIDIINCIINNNKSKIKIIIKINNIYNYKDLINIIDLKYYKNINLIMLDYPNIDNKYKKDIITNYNNLFKNYRYLSFYLYLNNKKYIDENILLEIKNSNKNFIGIINKTDYRFKNYTLINSLSIIIYNDLFFYKFINFKPYGIISPLFLLLFNYIYNNIILNINNNKLFIYDKNYYRFIKFINILYKKIYTISGIKFLLDSMNLCKFYVKYPINNINEILEYQEIKKIFNKIIFT
ncbi:MAG: dihydrodipicolinate synthase family protein [Candidatus Shikimatogenerans bostrichidophilus]|nr:MAG: dihydrodipicolinate synthase family protein [Candidatus Shikimatogenerans bostrichidophilus]